MSGSNFGLAPPVVVNPLQAQTTALDAAGKVYDLRDKQATEAAGQAFLNSIQNGQPDQTAFMENLRRNPATAMRALEASQKGQTLDSNTYKLHTERLSRANDAVGTLIGRYPNGIPQDAAHAAIQQELDSGLITPQEAQSLRTMFGDNPKQNSITATQIYTHNMSTQQQLDRRYGTRQAVPAGGSTEIVTVPPPGADQPNVSVTHTPTPAERYNLTPSYIPLDENGKPTTPDKARTWQSVSIPRQGVGDMPPAGPATVTTTPATPLPVPPVPPTGAFSNPNVPPNTAPGRINPTPANPALRNPAAQTAPAASPGIVQTPAGPAVVSAPPQGQQERLKQDQELYNTDVAKMGDWNRRATAGESALEALELVRGTGPMQDKFQRMYAFAQANGITPGVKPGDYTRTDAYQVLAKNLLRFAQDASSRSGTNLGLETQLHSNANVEDMLPGANRHVVLQDMGILRQQMAMQKGHPDKSGAGYGERTSKFPTDTDPIAFAWDLMTPGERQTYLTRLGDKSSAAYKKWASSMQEARNAGVWRNQP